MPKKILHIVTNEQFTDYAIQQFSGPEMCSEFILIPANHEDWFVKLIDRCTIIQPFSQDFELLLNRLNQYSGIVLHGMFWGKWQKYILEQVPRNVKIAWVFWGGDLYERHEMNNRFFTPITNILNTIHRYKKVRLKKDISWEIPLDLYKRVDICITSLKEEYDYARQFTNAPFKHFWYSYYSIEDTIGDPLLNRKCEGSNIWIGNSAAVQNNHLDVLWHLCRKGLLRGIKERNVVVPLSYGEPWMRNLAKRVGQLLFGKRLIALEKYIPREEYNAMMLSCSTMLIGYLEPAANGNIMTGLWLGMRVYLSEKSMAYAYYKRIGCCVFSIEHDLNQRNPKCFAKLSDVELKQNRKALMQEYGKQRTDKAVIDLVKLLTKT